MSPAGAATAMERVRQDAAHRLFGATVSVGIASLPPQGCDADTLHEQADAALYEAKRRGRNTAVLAAIIAFARKAGSRVVAEGIETVAMLEHVRQAGAQSAQGYLLGRPSESLPPVVAVPQALTVGAAHSPEVRRLPA